MFEDGNVMLNAMTLKVFFLRRVMRKDETIFQVNGQVKKPAVSSGDSNGQKQFMSTCETTLKLIYVMV